MRVALLGRMTMDLAVLKCGKCEPLKLGVHAGALGLAALCGIYNAAAWLSRREMHLAVNTVLYTLLTVWEQQHVVHHLAELRRPLMEEPPAQPTTAEKVEEVAAVAAVAAAVLAA